MLRSHFFATHSPPQPTSSPPSPSLISPPLIRHSAPSYTQIHTLTHTHKYTLLPIYPQNPLLCNLQRISCQMKFLFRKKKNLAVESSEASWLAAKAALVLKPIIQRQGFRCAESCDWQGSIWGPRLTWHLGFIRSGTKGRGKIIREGRRQINLFIPPHLPPPSTLHLPCSPTSQLNPWRGKRGGTILPFLSLSGFTHHDSRSL